MTIKKLLTTYLFFGVIGLLFVGPQKALAKELIKIDKALSQILPVADRIDKESIFLSEAQVIEIQEKANVTFGGAHQAQVTVYKMYKDGVVMAYVFEDVVKGKWGPIHYLVGLDTKGNILETIVLDYQEIRGRPIAKKRFLNQYKGKNIHNSLTLRKDIDGITGATISSTSLTDGVRKIVYIFNLGEGQLK